MLGVEPPVVECVCRSSTKAGRESEITLMARDWSRRASDQRMGVENGKALRWPPSVEHKVGKETNGLVILRLDQTSVGLRGMDSLMIDDL